MSVIIPAMTPEYDRYVIRPTKVYHNKICDMYKSTVICSSISFH